MLSAGVLEMLVKERQAEMQRKARRRLTRADSRPR